MIQYGPIKRWPGKLRQQSERARPPFKGSYGSTINLLEKELRQVSAEAAVVQIALQEKQFRRDGRPFADAEPEHPGAIVSFHKWVKNAAGQRVRVPLSFPADRFTTWEANLRAVAIALEDLRRIDRYGVTQNSEQYLGFKALPPPGPAHADIQTVEDAAEFVGRSADVIPSLLLAAASIGSWRDAYRTAAAKFHPDAGGRPEDWAKLQAAKTLLDEHHGKAVPGA